MADPGERIALKQGCREQPPEARQEGGDDEHCRDARTGEVQPARSAVRMLAQIERIKLPEAGEGPFTVHAEPSGKWDTCIVAARGDAVQYARDVRGSLTDAGMRRRSIDEADGSALAAPRRDGRLDLARVDCRAPGEGVCGDAGAGAVQGWLVGRCHARFLSHPSLQAFRRGEPGRGCR